MIIECNKEKQPKAEHQLQGELVDVQEDLLSIIHCRFKYYCTRLMPLRLLHHELPRYLGEIPNGLAQN